VLRRKLITINKPLWKTVRATAKVLGKSPRFVIETAIEEYLSAQRVGMEARQRGRIVGEAFSRVEEQPEQVVEQEKSDFKTMGHQNSHPCVHLRRVAPDWLRVDECEGTCGHPSQKGKTCYWNPAACRSCALFEHKRKDLFT
jgi:hypothetical protein